MGLHVQRGEREREREREGMGRELTSVIAVGNFLQKFFFLNDVFS